MESDNSVIGIIDSKTFDYSDEKRVEAACLEALRIIDDETILPGMTVLIKPNMVMDVNEIQEYGTDCLYTNVSVLKPVVDYVLNKLEGKGKIFIGDAPMQECKFDRIKGYADLVNSYRDKGFDVTLVDFRELHAVVVNGVHVQNIEEEKLGIVVNLGDNSEFAGMNEKALSRMRISNYEKSILLQHHSTTKHEYYISKYVLSADVIINMPKPKTHKKAGVTIALKNMVGINARKEYLPHHTMGAVPEGGDEYPRRSIVNAFRSKMLDKKNWFEKHRLYFFAWICRAFVVVCSYSLRFCKDVVFQGSWHGNRTICKTIVDLNKIILYADKNGIMRKNLQRKIIILADMIVSGEGDGPVAPRPKKVGLIVVGKDPLLFDETVTALMGFDPKKIPTLNQARNVSGDYKISEQIQPTIVSNSPLYNGKTLHQIQEDSQLFFEAAPGWKGEIESNREYKTVETDKGTI